MFRSSIGITRPRHASRKHLVDFVLQLFARASEPALHGAFRQRPFARDVAHALAGEVNVLEQVRVRAPEARETPIDDGRGVRVVGCP
jgi:hypothetical protein